jgi:hypothetical protein
MKRMKKKISPRLEPEANLTSINADNVEQAASVVNNVGCTRELVQGIASPWRSRLEYILTETEHGFLIRWRRVGSREPWTHVTTGPGTSGRLKAFATRTEAMSAADQEARKASVL